MYKAYLLLRILLYPFLRYLLPLFSGEAKKRIAFENLNNTQVQNIISADYGFEISSEGELEQVKIVLNRLLEEGESLEILFCSPSVEEQCQRLFQIYPNQVRLYRVPLLSFNPFSDLNDPGKWMTCNKLFMCRYDFYPELINYGATKAKEFTLFAATLKNFDKKPKPVQKYLRYCYQQFQKVVAVTNCGREEMNKIIGISMDKIEVYDFRVVQIGERQEKRNDIYLQKLPHHNTFIQFLNQIPANKKFIFGSYWRKEFPLFTGHNFTEDTKQFFVFPHQLKKKNIEAIIDDFNGSGIKVFEFNQKTTIAQLLAAIEKAKKHSMVWVMNLKGVLCEMYTSFDYAYVGGGYGVSVHSLLEPYLGGSIVFCGPRVHRSTEYTLIKENSPKRIFVTAQLEEVLELMFLEATHETDSLEDFKLHYEGHLGVLLFWLGLSQKSEMVC